MTASVVHLVEIYQLEAVNKADIDEAKRYCRDGRNVSVSCIFEFPQCRPKLVGVKETWVISAADFRSAHTLDTRKEQETWFWEREGRRVCLPPFGSRVYSLFTSNHDHFYKHSRSNSAAPRTAVLSNSEHRNRQLLHSRKGERWYCQCVLVSLPMMSTLKSN